MHTASPALDEAPVGRRGGPPVWRRDRWRALPIHQQPSWPDPAQLRTVLGQLATLPALTAVDDVRRLEASLARVAAGQAFLIQAGDCAEPMDATGVAAVRGKHRLIGMMAETVSDRADLPTVAVGRIGGQFAKPRSEPTEVVDDRELPVFRGQLVNDPRPDERLRTPDPQRLLAAYRVSRTVLNELHILAHERATHGLADTWPHPLPQDPGRGPHPIDRPWDGSLRSVIAGYGETLPTDRGGWTHTGLWTSHESLVLDYEEPLVRRDPRTGEWFLLSTHMPWIGERTRAVGGAHVEFHATIANPVGCKIGPNIAPEEIVALCAALNPNRRPGRLTLICRMGADRVRDRLPALARAVRAAGHHVVWVCDPMHGNTEKLATGRKTRRVERILHEIEAFFAALREAGEWPGGVHLEATDDDVTECLDTDGTDDGAVTDDGYRTLCDPRLNEKQALRVTETVSRLVAQG
ncbi:3-deoxy-7-phosphoheptulonate synthase [Nocardiopsis lucentensis]|uniref:3-deoxy-7-phosphoheptulonate synthase n=1 Tax=Nocardiopsis lucentensis TaxID=53441 RepID=UPI0003471463|nr:3-deoxy-7-phosphoheptulonate synthase [Nocardiopsis lucentensis]